MRKLLFLVSAALSAQVVNTSWSPDGQLNPFACGSRCVDSVNGNDANDGRTPYTAKKTIAALGAITDGMTIGVSRGSRLRELLAIQSASGVTVSAYGRGPSPILDGANPLSQAGWTQDTNCWFRDVTTDGASTNGWINVLENGTYMTSSGGGTTGSTTCNAAAARTYYVQCASGCSNTVHNNTNFRIYIRPSAGVTPLSAGDGYYEYSARKVSFDCFNNTGNGCSVFGMTFRMNYDGDGQRFSGPIVIQDSRFLQGGKHNIFVSGTNSGQTLDACAGRPWCGVLRRVDIQDSYWGTQSYTGFVLNQNTPTASNWLLDGVNFSSSTQQTVGGAMLCHGNLTNFTANGAVAAGVNTITLNAPPAASLVGQFIYSDGTGIPWGTTVAGISGTVVTLSANTAAAMVTGTKIYIGQYGTMTVMNSTSNNNANSYASCGQQFNLINSSANTTQKYFLVSSPTVVRGGSFTGSTVANAITLQQSNMADGQWSLDLQGVSLTGGNPMIGQASASPQAYTGVTGAGTNVRISGSTITLTGANPKALQAGTIWNFIGSGNVVDSSGTTGGTMWSFTSTPNYVLAFGNDYRTNSGGNTFNYASVARTWRNWYLLGLPAGCTLGTNCSDEASTMSYLTSAVTNSGSVLTFSSTTGVSTGLKVTDFAGCIPANTVISGSPTATQVTLSNAVTCPVTAGARIAFSSK